MIDLSVAINTGDLSGVKDTFMFSSAFMTEILCFQLNSIKSCTNAFCRCMLIIATTKL